MDLHPPHVLQPGARFHRPLHLAIASPHHQVAALRRRLQRNDVVDLEFDFQRLVGQAYLGRHRAQAKQKLRKSSSESAGSPGAT